MKVTKIIAFLFLFFPLPLTAQQIDGWQWGARGGAIGVPYTLADNRIGTGIYIGLAFQSYQASKTGYSFTLDYRKINNLSIERLKEFHALLPDAAIRGAEYLSISGFAGLMGGLHFDREIKRIGTGKLKLGLDGYAELMTTVFARQQSSYFATNYISALSEDDDTGFLSTAGGAGSSEVTRSTTDDLSVIFLGGMSLVYEFAAGPQLTCGLLVDLTTRFSMFAESSDAKLTQVHVGFTYPFRTKIN